MPYVTEVSFYCKWCSSLLQLTFGINFQVSRWRKGCILVLYSEGAWMWTNFGILYFHCCSAEGFCYSSSVGSSSLATACSNATKGTTEGAICGLTPWTDSSFGFMFLWHWVSLQMVDELGWKICRQVSMDASAWAVQVDPSFISQSMCMTRHWNLKTHACLEVATGFTYFIISEISEDI